MGVATAPGNHHVARRLAFAVCAVTLGVGACLAAADEPAAPHAMLEQKGLTRVGSCWVCSQEIRLRKRLESLPRLEMQIVTTQRYLAGGLHANKQLLGQCRSIEETCEQMKQARERFPPGSSQREDLDKNIEQQTKLLETLQEKTIEPAELIDLPEIQERLVSLTNNCNLLALALLQIREASTTVSDRYVELSADREIVRAIEQLAGSHRLGPIRDYAQGLSTLGKYERLVFSSSVPTYRESGFLRVGAIINGRAPVILSLGNRGAPTWITTNMLEAAGFEVPPDAPRVSRTFGENRRLSVRQIAIPRLQLGKHTFRDVSAYVLPPQAEDLGGQIGSHALPGYRIVENVEQLRLTIERGG